MKVKKEYEELEMTVNWNGRTKKLILGELTSDELEDLTLKGIDISKWVENTKPYKGIKHGRKRTIQSTVAEQDHEDNEDLSV